MEFTGIRSRERSRGGVDEGTVPGIGPCCASLSVPRYVVRFPGRCDHPRPGHQKLLGSQMTSAVAMLKKMMATARITILRRRSSHFSPTPQRKRTIAKIRVVRI